MRRILMALALMCASGQAFAQEAFVPNRPGATDTAIAVPAGRLQVETEIASFARDEDAGVTAESWSVAATAFRYGLGDGVDVELLVSPYLRTETTGADSVDGAGDVTLRLRKNLMGQDGEGPSLGVMGYVTLPTASDGLGAEDVEGGVIVMGEFALAPSWALAWTVSAGAISTPGDDYDAQGSAALVAAYAFNDRWSGYVEAAVEKVERQDAAASGGAGVTYLLGPETQLDAGITFGLNDAADDASLFVGWAHRF